MPVALEYLGCLLGVQSSISYDGVGRRGMWAGGWGWGVWDLSVGRWVCGWWGVLQWCVLQL